MTAYRDIIFNEMMEQKKMFMETQDGFQYPMIELDWKKEILN